MRVSGRWFALIIAYQVGQHENMRRPTLTLMVHWLLNR